MSLLPPCDLPFGEPTGAAAANAAPRGPGLGARGPGSGPGLGLAVGARALQSLVVAVISGIGCIYRDVGPIECQRIPLPCMGSRFWSRRARRSMCVEMSATK